MSVFRKATTAGAVAFAAVAMVATTPQLALAGGGTVRDDDGSRETYVDMDYTDDQAVKRLVLPSGIMSGATSATLTVLAQADACGTLGNSQSLLVNGTTAVDFNPCDKFSTAAFTWATFPISTGLLVDGATNSFEILEIAGDWTDRNAFYGVDSSTDFGRSDIFQASCCFTGDIPGELMWYLTVVAPSGSPGMSVTPTSIAFGSVTVGSSSANNTVTVTSTGTATLTVSSVTVGGSHPGDFPKSSDGCSGASLSPGFSCTFQVRFAPSATGSRSATVSISGNAGTATVSLSGTGVGDTTPPTSSFTTANGAILVSGGAVLGSSSDNWSGIWFVRVTFTPVTTLLAPTTVTATLTGCTATSCTWSAPAPLVPGVYLVNARATDNAGNPENPGPAITIIVA